MADDSSERTASSVASDAPAAPTDPATVRRYTRLEMLQLRASPLVKLPAMKPLSEWYGEYEAPAQHSGRTNDNQQGGNERRDGRGKERGPAQPRDRNREREQPPPPNSFGQGAMGDFRLQTGTLPTRGPRKSDPTSRDEHPQPSGPASLPSAPEAMIRRQGAEALRSVNQPQPPNNRRAGERSTAADEGGWRTVPRSGPQQSQQQSNGRTGQDGAQRNGRDGNGRQQSDRPGMRDAQRGGNDIRRPNGERMAVDRNGERRRWNDDVPNSGDGPGSGSAPAWMDFDSSSKESTNGFGAASSSVPQGGHADMLQAFKAEMKEKERRERMTEGGFAAGPEPPSKPPLVPITSPTPVRPASNEPDQRTSGFVPAAPSRQLVDPAATQPTRPPAPPQVPQPSLVMPDGMSIAPLVEPTVGEGKPRASRFAKFFAPTPAAPGFPGPIPQQQHPVVPPQPPPQQQFGGPIPLSFGPPPAGPPTKQSDMESMRRVMNMLQFSRPATDAPPRRTPPLPQHHASDFPQRSPTQQQRGPPPPMDGMFGRGPPPPSSDFGNNGDHRSRQSHDYNANAAALANILSGAQAAMSGARYPSGPGAPSAAPMYAGSIASAPSPTLGGGIGRAGPHPGYGGQPFNYGQPSQQQFRGGPPGQTPMGLFGQAAQHSSAQFYGQQQPPPGFGPQGRGQPQPGYASGAPPGAPNADLLALMAGGIRARRFDESGR